MKSRTREHTRYAKAIMSKLIKRYWVSITALLVILITILSLHPLETLPEVPGSDKTHHIVAYCALAFPVAFRKYKGWQLLITCLAFYSGLIELIQPYVNRYADLVDFFANCCGLAIGIGAAFIANKIEDINA